ncbi:MAG: 30S ribosomal protein S20 [Raoultibacter sp.]
MANIKSQKKRIKTNEKARLRNRAVRSELKTATRAVRDAVEANNGTEAYAAALAACRLLDKAASKGVIHKRQASNRKSGIMLLVNPVVTADDIAAYKPAKKKKPEVSKGGSKKAVAKAERQKAVETAAKEKAKRRTETEKSQKAAAKKKADAEAKEAAEAAKAEAAAAEAPAEEAAE